MEPDCPTDPRPAILNNDSGGWVEVLNEDFTMIQS